MLWTYILSLLSFILLYQEGEAISCHVCNADMGGCGDDLMWTMHPWVDCGDSEFCIKVIEKNGAREEIIRECENVLAYTTKHRLKMPVNRRSGYCSYGRGTKPDEVEYKQIKYCFCNDWNGCNSAERISQKIAPLAFLCFMVTILLTRFL